jgi:polysaccharide deacetylase family protein (PEP-CTERM system associated)
LCCSNILTVDVEDWYHICGPDAVSSVPRAQWRVRHNVEQLLELLAGSGHKATFFMLGSVAENVPELAPLISSQGHEIASHGYSHRVVTSLTPDEFRDELLCTERILEQQTGQRPIGYRAPQWSLSECTPWAFEILREAGYRYDSSLNPLPFVGNRAGSRKAYQLEGAGQGLWEIPPLVTTSRLCNLPTGGGWGFRFFPLSIICRSIDRLNKDSHPAVLFLHPRELEADGPRLELPLFQSFYTYGPGTSVVHRLKELFKRYRFTTIKEQIDLWQRAS